MKLFLCSLGITNKGALQTLFGKPLSKIKCGVIKNPMDLKDKEKRTFLYTLVDKGFEDFGIKKVDIDLRDYETRQTELRELITDLDFLWITGGNVFYLRELIKKVKFESILKKAINTGLVYGGDSAGALITCPTLKYLDAVDDTSQISEVIYEGLNIIDFVPLPHWDDGSFKPKLVGIKKGLEREGYKVITFGDKQTVVVNNKSIEVVG